MGAWIEIYRRIIVQSHPMDAWIEINVTDTIVASFMGAWIEIDLKISSLHDLSHPLWVRGLKLHRSNCHVMLRSCRILYGCVD